MRIVFVIYKIFSLIEKVFFLVLFLSNQQIRRNRNSNFHWKSLSMSLKVNRLRFSVFKQQHKMNKKAACSECIAGHFFIAFYLKLYKLHNSSDIHTVMIY